MATADSIYPPTGIAVDPGGNLFFTSNNSVFQLSPNGILTRLAGNSQSGWSGDGGSALNAQLAVSPGGVALDGAGNLYVADTGNYRVRKIAVTGIITTVAGNGRFAEGGDGGPAVSASIGSPIAVAIDGNGDLFIADQAYVIVRKVSPDGTIATVFNGGSTGTASGAPLMGLALDGAGNLFVSDAIRNVIHKISATGEITTIAGTGVGGFSGDGGPAANAQLSWPSGMALDAAGNLYFADTHNFRIRKIGTDGIITTVAGGGNAYPGNGVPAAQANLYSPAAIAVGGDGNLYLAAGWIQKVTTDGIISIIAGNGTYNYSGDGGPATNAQLWEPSDVVLDGTGNVFIVDSANQVIRRVDSSGIITTFAGNGHCQYSGDGGPAMAASFCNPVGAAMDSSGNLYIADSTLNRIRKIDSSGVITTVAGNGAAGWSGDGGPAVAASVNYPLGVAVDPAGNLIIADYENDRIRKVSKDGIITTVGGSGTRGYSGDGGPATSASLFIPRAVTVDAKGNIFFVDSHPEVSLASGAEFEPCPDWVPPWTGVGGALESLRKQWTSAGSIRGSTEPQKFETYPDWGANNLNAVSAQFKTAT